MTVRTVHESSSCEEYAFTMAVGRRTSSPLFGGSHKLLAHWSECGSFHQALVPEMDSLRNDDGCLTPFAKGYLI